MKIIIITLILISSSLFSRPKERDDSTWYDKKNIILVAKPVYNYSFTKASSLFGAELGFWNQSRSMKHLSDYLGGDLGLLLNTDNNYYSLYLEAQLANRFLGVSLGVFWDINKEDFNSGIQCTFWANFFIGTYFRVKQSLYFDNAEFSLGLYFAIPVNPDIY